LPDLPGDESWDDLILGGLKIIQPRSGYRFSIDAVLLAHFPDLYDGMQVFDLGTGSGVIALLLAYRHKGIHITGLDIQEQMVDRARRSVQYNKLEKRITIIKADINQVTGYWPPAQADLVVCNPPFWKKGQGKVSLDPEQAVARHELKVTLPAILQAGAHLLKTGGRLAMVLPARRLTELFSELAPVGLKPVRLRMIHPTIDREAGHFLIEAGKGTRGEMTIMPPLIIYERAGVYTQEIQHLYERSPGEERSQDG